MASASGHISKFFETLSSLRIFTNGAQRHAIFLEIQKKMHPHRQPLVLERPSDTRWSSRASSLSKVLQLLDVILEMLAPCSEKNDEILSRFSVASGSNKEVSVFAGNQGRTGTKFQAGKSHTHPGHPIHPQLKHGLPY